MGCFWKQIPKAVYSVKKCLSSHTETSERRKKHKVNEGLFLTSAPVVGISSLLRKSYFFIYSIQNFVACNRELMSFMLPYLLFYQLPTFKRNSIKEVKIYFKRHRRGTDYSTHSVQRLCGFISLKIIKY